MNDLLTSAAESAEERIAIMESDGIEVDHETERHRCEVQWIIRAYYPKTEPVTEYLNAVEKKRGKEAADKLRVDCREAWKKRRDSE